MSKLDFRPALALPYDRPGFVRDVLRPVFGAGRLSLFHEDLSTGDLTATDQRLAVSAVQYGELLLDDGTEVRCLEVRLQPRVRPEQSRVGIQQLVRRLLTAGQAGLVSFVPAPADAAAQPWRLTLVARDTVLSDGKLVEHTTHARRYTYLLGPGQAGRTPAERLRQLAGAPAVELETLVKAFEVDVLSKEFFKEYKRHYELFCAELTKSNFKKSVFNGDEKAIRDFAKKLLGRLVFLYFVQKKGWLGASSTAYDDGDPDFVMNLFNEAGANDTFYPVWLSKLFFETLNQRRTDDRFAMPDKKQVRVPFLNGGLFDRGKYDAATLTMPAALFAHPKHGDDPARRGYLDFLNAYNFTIYEDSPDDQTVAVDPEMLGHIFENLLEENRAKGAIYTPRAIVHFMCQQSLVQYLETKLGAEKGAWARQLIIEKRLDHLPTDWLREADEALSKVRVCDPAIGSGAFPMGLLQEIFAVQELIHFEQGFKTWSPARVKARIIQQSIYGVDVDAGAVDIARLRFWLALVVDESAPRELPNLDYKIMQGNSLLESFEGVALDKLTGSPADEAPTFAKRTQLVLGQEFSETAQATLVFSAKQQKELDGMMRDFYEVTDPAVKIKSREQINKLIEKQLQDHLTSQLASRNHSIRTLEADLRKHFGPQFATVIKPKSAQAKQYAALLAERAEWEAKKGRLLDFQKGSDRPYFLWHTYFREVFEGPDPGFDIVVANPPYIRVQGVKNTQDREKLQYEATYTGVAEGAYDLANLFVVLALRLGNSRCANCFIFPHKFFNADSSTGIRDLLLNGSKQWELGGRHMHKVAHFGANQVFNEADTYVCIALFSPQPATEGFRIQKFAHGADYHALMNDEERYRLVSYERLADASRLYGGNQWIFFGEEDEYALFADIYKGKRRIEDLVEIYVGLQTSNDKLYLLDVTDEDDQYYWGTNGLSSKVWKVEKDFFKPMLKGRDVQRYAPLATRAHVFFPYMVKGKEAPLVTLATLKSKYKATYEYVKLQEDEFKAREGGKAGRTMPEWHGYIYPKNLVKFEQRRLSNMEICSAYPNVTLNEGHLYHATTVYSWVKRDDAKESYEYLLTLANSQLLWWFLKNTGDTLQGDARRLKSSYLNPFPLPEATTEAQRVLGELARYLLWLGDETHPMVTEMCSNKAVAQFLRQVVDAAVCELYFGAHMREEKIDVLAYLQKEVVPLPTTGPLGKQAAIIKQVFEGWQASASEVRNRLKLIHLRSANKLAYILTA